MSSVIPTFRPTMQDVAREAGVSAMTVSRVLKDPAKVAAATRERVEAAVARLGYVPDRIAGALSSGQSGLIAALLPTLAGSIFNSTVAGMSTTLDAEGYQLLLGITDYSIEGEEALLRAAISRRPDGLVVTGGRHTAGARELLRQVGLPTVETWELPDDPIDMAVGFSNRAAGRAMTDFLAELGYQRIAFLGIVDGIDSRGQERWQGYLDALSARSIGPPRSVAGGQLPADPKMGAMGLGELLERFPDTDAVFCASDPLALGAVMEASRLGLAVPEAIAIAGFGDFEYADPHGLALTTIHIPGERIGEETARLLLPRRDNQADPGMVIDVGFDVVRRKTA